MNFLDLQCKSKVCRQTLGIEQIRVGQLGLEVS